MDAVISVPDAQVDTEDYYFDLDAGADTAIDAGAEDFDFKLDGTYDDEAQGVSADTDTGSASKPAADFEIGYEDEEPAVPTESDTTKPGDIEHDVNQSLNAEYQDEIGYEDEELDANGAVEDSEARELGGPGAGQESILRDHGKAEVLDDATLNDGLYEPNGEEISTFDVGADAPADTTDDASTHHSHPDNAHTPASGLGDLQETPADLSSASLVSSAPDLIVHYNQGRYSLVGAPSDDPDSYFLSDTKDLDGSLAHMLSSIRAVISDEIAPEDELVVRIDALDLEFGEKSSQKFLDRSFHEILRCFSALFGDSENDAQELELDLLTRRDCETRFIELLEEAGLADEPIDHPMGFEGVEDEDSEDVSIDDFQEDLQPSEDLVGVTTGDDPSETAEQNQKGLTPQAAPENGEANVSTSFDFSADPSGTDSVDLAQFEEGNGDNFEDEYLEIQSGLTNEADGAEKGDGYALEGVNATDDLGQAFAGDEMFEEPELSIDIAENSVLEQGADDWGVELDAQEGLDTGEATTAGEMLEPVSHGNDATLSLGAGPALATIHEQGVPGSFELSHETDPSGSRLTMDKSIPEETTFVDTQEVKSLHTSRTSTINGDEMGCDEDNQTGDLPSKQSLNQPGTPGDEIDWEDGDQNPLPTPSAKRSRTNEPEGPSDGIDNKRRRT